MYDCHAAYYDVAHALSSKSGTQVYKVGFFRKPSLRLFFHCSKSSWVLKRKTPLGERASLGSRASAVLCKRSKRSQYGGRFLPPTTFMLFGSVDESSFIRLSLHRRQEFSVRL